MYGRPGSSQEELEAAAKAAYAHDFITSFPDGYAFVTNVINRIMPGPMGQRQALYRSEIKQPNL